MEIYALCDQLTPTPQSLPGGTNELSSAACEGTRMHVMSVRIYSLYAHEADGHGDRR